MQEHLKALVVILAIATAAFALVKQPASQVIEPRLFKLRCKLWYFLTVIAFISHSYVVFACVAVVILSAVKDKDSYPVALFFSLLFLIPPAAYQIPGFGMVNYILMLDNIRFLTIVVLVPAALKLRYQPGNPSGSACHPDKFLALYFLFAGGLAFRDTSFTDGARQIVYLVLDVLIPYYVASRSLRDTTAFKNVFTAFLISTLVLSMVAIYEYSRHWLLYRAVVDALELHWGMGNYLGRAGSLRASASTGQAIVLGYLIVIAAGMLIYLSGFIVKQKRALMLAAILAGGLFVTLSRGPWVGAAILIVCYLATGPGAIRKLAILFIVSLLSLPLLSIVPGGDKVLDLLPFVGSVEKENIDYRQKLIDNSLSVIERNPWFGSNDYLNSPEMQEMRQGQGIIDIVNTYIGIALQYGGIGVAIFFLFFISILFAIFGTIRSSLELNNERAILGRVLLSITVAALFIIFTVSSISFIPVVYWSIAGLGVAYVRMVRAQASTNNA